VEQHAYQEEMAAVDARLRKELAAGMAHTREPSDELASQVEQKSESNAVDVLGWMRANLGWG